MARQRHMLIRISRVLIGLVVLFGFIGLSASRSWANDGQYERATLRGLQGVSVLVEGMDTDAQRIGLSPGQVQTDVELRLRQAGIPVLTQKEWLEAPGVPFLYVHVPVLLLSEGLAAVYHIAVELHQVASLETVAYRTAVSTWSAEGLGSVDNLHFDSVRQHILRQVDRFINAYLSVHLRPAGSAAPSSASPRRDLVRQVQMRLHAVGFNPGTIDGSMGPQTQQALRWFQNAKGLTSTGDLDEHTLNALEVR